MKMNFYSKDIAIPVALGFVAMCAYVAISIIFYSENRIKNIEYESAPEEVRQILDRNIGKTIPSEEMKQIAVLINREKANHFDEIKSGLSKGGGLGAVLCGFMLVFHFLTRKRINFIEILAITCPTLVFWLLVVSM